MASRRGSFLSLPRQLLLMAAVLGTVVLLGEGATARPLLGIAEPPASPGAAAAAPGPGVAAQAAEAGGGRAPDRSEAGVEVILAGFAAAVAVVIVCYIRVTRESKSGSGSVGEKRGSLGGF
jgi:hypothetical protein